MTKIRAIELRSGDALLGQHGGMIQDWISSDSVDGMIHVLVRRAGANALVWVHIPSRQLVDAHLADVVAR